MLCVADVLTADQRKLNMSRIRGRDTKPEMLVRRGLHIQGFRYRLHDKSLPGCPDLVFPKYRAVIFVHGCFWHGHDCPMFRLPATRREFWERKINTNRVRDANAHDDLLAAGWRILTIWECSLRGKNRLDLESLTGRCAAFLEGNESELVLSGVDRSELPAGN